MPTYDYRAVWVSSLPDPRGVWHVRVYNPETNKVLVCNDRMSECSLLVPGNKGQEEIEAKIITFLEDREGEMAAWPAPLHGTVDF